MCAQLFSEPVVLQQTKLHPPRATASSLIHRERLIETLNASEQHVLVIAPAGYGKTTLTAQWLEASYPDAQVGWVSLDTLDNNVSIFLSYVMAALQQHQATSDDQHFHYANEVYQHPQTIITTVINDLMQGADAPKLLVLDDYHLIDADNEAIHSVVRSLLTLTSPHLKVVILSRQSLPYPIAKMRAEGRITELLFDDLRFTREEVRVYFETRFNVSLSEQPLSRLSQSTEGWGVGLALLALRLQQTNDIAASVARYAGTEKLVSDYLLSEIFEQQSTEVQHFLMQTSLLNRLHGDLIDAVLQRHESHAQLVNLEQMGLLIVPLDRQRKWYRYHHFFLDFLQDRLAQSDTGWQLSAHARASAWFAEHADNTLEAISAALYHAQQANTDMLLRTLERFGVWLLKHGHQQLIVDYLDPFSMPTLGRFPKVLIWYLWALLSVGDFDRMHYVMRYALRYIPYEMQGDILAMRAEIEPDALKQRALCEEARSLLTETDHITRCLLDANIARSAFFIDGETKYAIQSLTHIVTQFEQLKARQLWAISLDCLIMMHQRHGTLDEAEAWCHHGIVWCEQNDRMDLVCAFYSQLGKILYEQNRLAEAKKILIQCRQLCEMPVNLNSYIAASLTLSRCLAAGEPEAILNALRQRVRTSVDQQRRIDNAREVHLADHGWIIPRIDWQKVTFDPQSEQVTVSSLYTYLVLARRMTYGDKAGLRPAVSLLNQLQGICQRIERKSDLIDTLILLSIAYERLGKRNTAIYTLEEALRIAEHTGHKQLFLDGGKYLNTLLAHITQQKFGHTDSSHLFDPAHVASPKALEIEIPLTQRETEILTLIGQGLTNAEISTTLSISLNTTRWHLKNLFRKLQVDNRTKASAYARHLGLLK